MASETLLSELVGQAHFVRARDKARTLAAKYAVPVYVYRTTRGFSLDVTSPTLGERWSVEPTGQVTHVAGPVA